MRRFSFLAKFRTKPCHELVYYLAIFAVVLGGAFLRQVNLLYLVAGFLVGPILLNYWLVGASLKRLSICRKFPMEICSGDLLIVSLELENRRRRLDGWALSVKDPICRLGRKVTTGAVSFPYLIARSKQEAVYQGHIAQRGVYKIGPSVIESSFPFGLFRRSLTIGTSDELVVFPRPGLLNAQWLTRRHEAFEGGGHRHFRQSRIEGEFYGIRDWSDGDSYRTIHSRSSARHGKPIVRQFEQTYNRDVAVLVDLTCPLSSGKSEQELAQLTETAISFAATVIGALCRRGGANIWLSTTDEPNEIFSGAASVGLVGVMMRQLALVESSREDRLDETFNQMQKKVSAGTDWILVSPVSIDLDDVDRFPSGFNSSGRRAIRNSLRLVNCDDENLGDIFSPTGTNIF
jgi:uncharacterized protein (DUF58 family)